MFTVESSDGAELNVLEKVLFELALQLTHAEAIRTEQETRKAESEMVV